MKPSCPLLSDISVLLCAQQAALKETALAVPICRLCSSSSDLIQIRQLQSSTGNIYLIKMRLSVQYLSITLSLPFAFQ